ncbi:hydrogenase maturation protease [Chloroflexota bacterium]
MGSNTGSPGTLIIGLGNPLRGDDGVGVRVVQALSTQTLPADLDVVDGGTQGLGIVSLLEGRDRVIVIDAADVGLAPGQYLRFELDEANLLGADRHVSIHAAGLRDALMLAQALKVLPEKVIIYGMQPASLDWDRELSSEVEAALPSLVAAVLEEATI